MEAFRPAKKGETPIPATFQGDAIRAHRAPSLMGRRSSVPWRFKRLTRNDGRNVVRAWKFVGFTFGLISI